MKELKPMIHDEKNGLDYILVGDYYIPLIRVAEEPRDIGFYGSLRRNFSERLPASFVFPADADREALVVSC